MRFTPKTEEQIDLEKLLPEGDYDFEVVKAEDSISKAGNDMIKMLLKVYRTDGTYLLVNDYLLEALLFKVRHFCEAVGILDVYENGDLCAPHCEGRTGRVTLKVEPGKDGYKSKNAVVDYVTDEASHTQSVTAQSGIAPAPSFHDDDIPF